MGEIASVGELERPDSAPVASGELFPGRFQVAVIEDSDHSRGSYGTEDLKFRESCHPICVFSVLPCHTA